MISGNYPPSAPPGSGKSLQDQQHSIYCTPDIPSSLIATRTPDEGAGGSD
jgi:hypothetical protein